jgi:DegV family protein with EDD domain
MSGTFNSADKVAKKLAQEGKKITIVDSKLNSNAEGLLVGEAARLIDEGYSHEEVVDKVGKLTDKIRIYVSLKDLTPMIKGGRISKTAGFVLGTLKLQPVVSIDKNGKGIVPYKTFSQKAAVKKILEQIKKDKKQFGIKKYSLVYSDKIDDIKVFKQKLIKLIGFEPEFITQISPVVGLNAGKGAFAVSYLMEGQ